MQGMHFGFALGAFIGPILAEPFLSTNIPTVTNASYSNVSTLLSKQETNEGEISVFHLFPILGSLSFVISFAYLAYEIVERKQGEKDMIAQNTCVTQSVPKTHTNQTVIDVVEQRKYSVEMWVFISIMLLFFVVYVGIESSFSSLLTAFSVKSKLGLTQQE